jgi:lactoylglutathione lyase
MKGLAFVKDPDGYWIEVVSRATESPISTKYTLAQTMMRVKDPVKSLHFYRDLLGMTLLNEKHMGVGEDWGFSLFFLASLPEGTKLPDPSSEGPGYARMAFEPVLELTHNHGTETKPDFK